MKADYVHKDTLTATDYVELNKNNEILMIYNQTLLKENKELKKQLDKVHHELYTLKNKYNIRLLNQLSENIEPDLEDFYLAEIESKSNDYDKYKTQQKEFIKYLEDEIKTLEKDILETIDDMDKYMKEVKLLIIEEILQKYKSIIGDIDDKK